MNDSDSTQSKLAGISASDMSTWPDLMNVEQLSLALGLRNKTVVYGLIARGELKGKKIGKIYTFTKRQILEWIQAE